MTRDPDILRVSKRQLRKLLVDIIAPKRADGILRELEERPEGNVMQGPISDEARMLAAQVLRAKERKRA